jgi:transcriptional regulator with XRE-family HTH domain
VDNQAESIDFNQRVGANVQRLRKAAGIAQADLARLLTERGLSFQQPTILKVEKGTRPLKFEEACAIADILEVGLASLAQYVDNEKVGEALAQIERSNLLIRRWENGIEEIHAQARQKEEAAREVLERMAAVKREAEQQLRDAGGFQDDEGRWWWHADGWDVMLLAASQSTEERDANG